MDLQANIKEECEDMPVEEPDFKEDPHFLDSAEPINPADFLDSTPSTAADFSDSGAVCLDLSGLVKVIELFDLESTSDRFI